jgi:hypothetical protein
MTICGVEKVIDLLRIHGWALIHKLGDLSQGLSCHWFIFFFFIIKIKYNNIYINRLIKTEKDGPQICCICFDWMSNVMFFGCCGTSDTM